MKFTETRLYVHRERPYKGGMGYEEISFQGVPQPHTSGHWFHKFDFTNDYFLLLQVF